MRVDRFDPVTAQTPVYRDGEANHCGGCSRTHWYIGRTMAECAFCGFPMPLAQTHVGSNRVAVIVGQAA